MNIKNLFCKNKSVKKDTIKFEKLPEISYEDDLGNEDKILRIVIGQWLGIIPSYTIVAEEGWRNYLNIRPEEVLKKNNLKDSDYELIDSRFSRILTIMGISNNDLRTLTNFNRKNCSFDCILYGDEEKYNINLQLEGMNTEPEITVSDGVNLSVYRFVHEDQENADRLDLLHFDRKLDNKGYKLARYAKINSYKCNLYNVNTNMSLSINIEYPSNTDYIDQYIDVDYLENAIAMLEFPVDIEEVCSIVAKYLKGNLEDYPLINIETVCKDTIINKATFEYNKWKKLIYTKNDITVSIDSNGDWDYSTEVFKTGVHKKDNYFTTKTKTKPQTYDKSMYVTEYVDDEIDHARKMVLTLFKK